MTVKLQANALVGALMLEMLQALEALQAGDYDEALGILERRCRPSDPLKMSDVQADSLGLRRLAGTILQLAPTGVLRSSQVDALVPALRTLETALQDPAWLAKPENALTAAWLANESGVSLVWDFEAGR